MLSITSEIYQLSQDTYEVHMFDSITHELFGINKMNLPFHTCVAIATCYKNNVPNIYFNLITKKQTLQATLELQYYKKKYKEIFIMYALLQTNKLFTRLPQYVLIQIVNDCY